MQKLVRGIHRFRSKITRDQAQTLKRLAKGQHPIAMMITCADSRINPNLITETDPGDLFILRNVGNIIPPHGTTNNGEAAAIEFAVAGLQIKDIIVCGHTHCGAMKGLLNPKSIEHLPSTTEWLKHAQATQQIMRENYAGLKGDKLLTAAAEENVLVQLQQLETIPVVAARIMRGELRLHAWMYKIETGEVFSYDWESNQFVTLPSGEKETSDTSGNGHGSHQRLAARPEISPSPAQPAASRTRRK